MAGKFEYTPANTAQPAEVDMTSAQAESYGLTPYVERTQQGQVWNPNANGPDSQQVVTGPQGVEDVPVARQYEPSSGVLAEQQRQQRQYGGAVWNPNGQPVEGQGQVEGGQVQQTGANAPETASQPRGKGDYYTYNNGSSQDSGESSKLLLLGTGAGSAYLSSRFAPRLLDAAANRGLNPELNLGTKLFGPESFAAKNLVGPDTWFGKKVPALSAEKIVPPLNNLTTEAGMVGKASQWWKGVPKIPVVENKVVDPVVWKMPKSAGEATTLGKAIWEQPVTKKLAWGAGVAAGNIVISEAFDAALGENNRLSKIMDAGYLDTGLMAGAAMLPLDTKSRVAAVGGAWAFGRMRNMGPFEAVLPAAGTGILGAKMMGGNWKVGVAVAATTYIGSRIAGWLP